MDAASASGLQTILRNPSSFFRNRKENPGGLIPLGIVVFVAMLAVIASIPESHLMSELAINAAQAQSQPTGQDFSGAVSAFSSIVTFVGAFVGVVGAWVLYAVMFYLIARFVFDGSGSFTDTLAFTGWGFIPSIIAKLIHIAAAYYALSDATLPEGNQAAQAAFDELQSDPVLFISGTIGLVLLIWSGILWTYAVDHLHEISRRDAIITVGIPLVISISLRLNGLL